MVCLEELYKTYKSRVQVSKKGGLHIIKIIFVLNGVSGRVKYIGGAEEWYNLYSYIIIEQTQCSSNI